MGCQISKSAYLLEYFLLREVIEGMKFFFVTANELALITLNPISIQLRSQLIEARVLRLKVANT